MCRRWCSRVNWCPLGLATDSSPYLLSLGGVAATYAGHTDGDDGPAVSLFRAGYPEAAMKWQVGRRGHLAGECIWIYAKSPSRELIKRGSSTSASAGMLQPSYQI